MCDCYHDACRGCGKNWPIHLENFATDRDEVVVFCRECFAKLPLQQAFRPWRAFRVQDGSEMVIVYLTDNALRHIEGNVPDDDYELIDEGNMLPSDREQTRQSRKPKV